MGQPLLLTPIEAASLLGIGRSSLYELLRTGALRSVRIGRCRRIPDTALKEFIQSLEAASDPDQPVMAIHRSVSASAARRPVA